MDKSNNFDFENIILKEVVVIGAGISGLAVARWLKEYGIDFAVIEKSDDIGGLWRYREKEDFGVMDFTHINVSKYNYCYSDHPFPDDCSEYPHHREMYNYIKSYANKHNLYEQILFKHEVLQIEELSNEHDLMKNKPQFSKAKFYDKLWSVKVKDLISGLEMTYVTPYACIASGHHSAPSYADFPGLGSFKGEVIHGVKYKSAKVNNLVGKRVCIVGIGNSSVDAAVNLVNEGVCPKVVISTRTGAWIVPNYVSGFATDLYATRALFAFPWKVSTNLFEAVIKFIYGNPKNYNLNPKVRAMQTQPTVAPTLIHHIQRKQITIKPNVKSVNGNEVTFENGDKEEFDCILLCTGYKIDLHFLSQDLKSKLFVDREETILNLFKHAFHPEIGRSLSFIGFIQPTSGGLLTVSEIQARWLTQLVLNKIKLPPVSDMVVITKKDQDYILKRFHNSNRHTIQADPIIYNDEVSEYFVAIPSFLANIPILWRLLFSSCGPAQWRLNGPDASSSATDIIKKVPVTDMMKFFALLFFLAILIMVLVVIKHPYVFGFLCASYFFYRNFYQHQHNKKH